MHRISVDYAQLQLLKTKADFNGGFNGYKEAIQFKKQWYHDGKRQTKDVQALTNTGLTETISDRLIEC